ncbi:hypothetical protein D9758_004162 [Tetrapyrgos nigripes]|uniref:VWFA domain-containing protein n=1 Tax=Tetrapyrgos nigripes TaxID=182062 RepID=A0A8H5GU53_9AGAR|nr:hypothetical protein D9758_004162 [Tetrapyrgos nigripes]
MMINKQSDFHDPGLPPPPYGKTAGGSTTTTDIKSADEKLKLHTDTVLEAPPNPNPSRRKRQSFLRGVASNLAKLSTIFTPKTPPVHVPEAPQELSPEVIRARDKALEAVLKPILNHYDLTFIVDDSGSMQNTDPGSMRSRWEEARDALMQLVDIGSKLVNNEIDICFLNHEETRKQTLRAVLLPYVCQLDEIEKKHGYQAVLRAKPVICIVITDGKPTDDCTEEVILDIAKRLEKGIGLGYFMRTSQPKSQLGIQFVQIGNDSEATKLLRKLGDDLKRDRYYEVSRDIVDTTRYWTDQSGKLTAVLDQNSIWFYQ